MPSDFHISCSLYTASHTRQMLLSVSACVLSLASIFPLRYTKFTTCFSWLPSRNTVMLFGAFLIKHRKNTVQHAVMGHVSLLMTYLWKVHLYKLELFQSTYKNACCCSGDVSILLDELYSRQNEAISKFENAGLCLNIYLTPTCSEALVGESSVFKVIPHLVFGLLYAVNRKFVRNLIVATEHLPNRLFSCSKK